MIFVEVEVGPEDLVSAEARLLAWGGTVRGGGGRASGRPGVPVLRRLASLSVAFLVGLAVGFGVGSGVMADVPLTSDLVDMGSVDGFVDWVDGGEDSLLDKATPVNGARE